MTTESLIDYASLSSDQFAVLRPDIEFTVSDSLAVQNDHFARYMGGRLQEAAARDATFSVVLPTGPIDYLPFVEHINRQRISMRHMHVFMMDDYCADETHLVDEGHPLSFRGFVNDLLLDQVDPELRMPADQLRFPDPADPAAFTARVATVGGVDVAYAGIGLSGHLAFNDPPDDEAECTVANVRDSLTRVVRLSRETIAQNALAGTRGLLEAVPPLAITIGMRELLEAREVHVYLLRKWHSGIVRKTFFGPVTPSMPASFLQEHPCVKVFMPGYVAAVPGVNVTLDI